MNNQSLLERRYSGRRTELKRVILTEALPCFLDYGIETTTIEMIRDRATILNHLDQVTTHYMQSSRVF